MPATEAELERVRVLIADSSELVRRGIRDVLHRDRRFVVVGEIARPQNVAEACLNLSPDIIFPGLGRDSRGGRDPSEGVVALREVVWQDHLALVIVLVDGDTVDDLLEPVQAGAAGVLLRDAPAGALLEAVFEVLEGGSALDPRLTRTLFEYLRPEAALCDALRGFKLNPAALRSLSPREQEVLWELTQGHRNKEIAAQLGVTVGTVKTHLRHIFRKLRVGDRTGAVLAALQVYPPKAA